MIVRFDKFNRMEKPAMTLCNPGAKYVGGKVSSAIGVLSDTSDEELQINFNTTSTLSLRLYKHSYSDASQSSHFSDLFDDVKPRRMIFVEDIGFFVIRDVDSGFDGDKYYKDISADSCEIEMQNKCLPYIENGTYQFKTGSTSTPGMLEKIIASMPMWTIGTVDTRIADLYRTFEDVDEDQNVLAFMLEDLQDAYECIFIFDTINRTVNVYDQNNYVHTTCIHLTKDDVVNSINIQEGTDDLYTAISVFGADDMSISAVNPMGGNVIYNFDYYLDWMSDSLRSAVNTWKEKLTPAKVAEYQDIGKTYNSKYIEYLGYVQDEEMYQTVLDVYKRCYDNIATYNDVSAAKTMITGYVSSASSVIEDYGSSATNSMDLTSYTTIADLQSAVTTKISDVNTLISTASSNKTAAQNTANSYLAQMTAIQNGVAIPGTSFTDSQYEELSNYISEGSYTDEYITFTDSMTADEKYAQMQTLYNRAVKQLERIAIPTQEFSVDTESFLFQKEFAHFASDLETGCVISVELSDNDVAGLFLSGITINYDDYKTSLKFGNRLCRFDSKSMFEDVLGSIKRSANSIEYIKDVLYPVKSGKLTEMQMAIANSRNITKESALSATNQCVVIDDTGYTGRKASGDGYDNEQVKIVNNSIVFTDNAWSTCSTAIGKINIDENNSAYGVNASVLVGDIILGNSLHIGIPSGSGSSATITQLEDTIVSVDVQYAKNSSSSTAPTSGWQTTAPAWENGKYIWQRTVTTYADGDVQTSAATCLTGATGATGASGAGIDHVVEWYGVSSSDTTQPTNWYTSFSSITLDGTNKYLWNKEEVFLTSNTTTSAYTTSPVVIGTFTKGISSITEHYLATSSVSGVSSSTSGWTTSIQTVTSSNKYLWNYETITYTDGSHTYTAPVIIGVYGDKGNTGKGISAVKEQYYLSTSNSSCTGGSWVDTCPEWVEGKYIWTRSYITYDDSSTSRTDGTLAGAINSANETASSASATANTANSTATAAYTLAGQKGTIYRTNNASSDPTSPTPQDGDLWINTKTQSYTTRDGQTATAAISEIKYYTGSDWVLQKSGATNIANGTITTDMIGANQIYGTQIVAGTITADHITAGGITVGASNSNSKIKLSSSTETAISNAQSTASNASTAASNAQSTANTALANASAAQSTANARASVFKQTSQPTANKVGDLWVKPATSGNVNGSEIRYWDGDSWELHQVGTTSIVNGSITTDLLAANAITADMIEAVEIISENIKLTGKMGVYTYAEAAPEVVEIDDWGNVISEEAGERIFTRHGYLGFGVGSNGRDNTYGMLLSSDNQYNYLIATDSGIRLQNYYTSGENTVDHKLYLSSGHLVHQGGDTLNYGNTYLNMSSGTIGNSSSYVYSGSTHVNSLTAHDSVYMSTGNGLYWGGDLCARRATLAGGGTAMCVGNSSIPTYLYGDELTYWDGATSRSVMLEPRVLYRNASPTSSFTGVSLNDNNDPADNTTGFLSSVGDISSYNMFYIEIAYNTGNSTLRGGTFVYVPDSNQVVADAFVIGYAGSAIVSKRRYFYIDKSKDAGSQIRVAVGQSITGSSYSVENSAAIPITIIGMHVQ